jgi:hypothetical protein
MWSVKSLDCHSQSYVTFETSVLHLFVRVENWNHLLKGWDLNFYTALSPVACQIFFDCHSQSCVTTNLVVGVEKSDGT